MKVLQLHGRKVIKGERACHCRRTDQPYDEPKQFVAGGRYGAAVGEAGAAEVTLVKCHVGIDPVTVAPHLNVKARRIMGAAAEARRCVARKSPRLGRIRYFDSPLAERWAELLQTPYYVRRTIQGLETVTETGRDRRCLCRGTRSARSSVAPALAQRLLEAGDNLGDRHDRVAAIDETSLVFS